MIPKHSFMISFYESVKLDRRVNIFEGKKHSCSSGPLQHFLVCFSWWKYVAVFNKDYFGNTVFWLYVIWYLTKLGVNVWITQIICPRLICSYGYWLTWENNRNETGGNNWVKVFLHRTEVVVEALMLCCSVVGGAFPVSFWCTFTSVT